MAETHEWLHNPATAGDWQCPADLVNDYLARGWARTEAPPEPDPALAEHIAWRKQLAAEAAPDEAVAEAADPKAAKKAAAKPTTAAVRGESEE